MKIINVKEAQMHYLVETGLSQPAILQRDGEPVAAIIPIEEFNAFREWKSNLTRQKSKKHLDFEAEIAAYERLRPELLKRYQGRVVAIAQGQVVEVGDKQDTKMSVLTRVRARLGNIPCYIEYVEANTPRRARVPSSWAINQ